MSLARAEPHAAIIAHPAKKVKPPPPYHRRGDSRHRNIRMKNARLSYPKHAILRAFQSDLRKKQRKFAVLSVFSPIALLKTLSFPQFQQSFQHKSAPITLFFGVFRIRGRVLHTFNRVFNNFGRLRRHFQRFLGNLPGFQQRLERCGKLIAVQGCPRRRFPSTSAIRSSVSVRKSPAAARSISARF